MSGYESLTATELNQVFSDWGFSQVRSNGGHAIWEHPDHPGQRIPITAARRSTTPPKSGVQLASALLGLTPKEFRAGPTREALRAREARMAEVRRIEAEHIARAEAAIAQREADEGKRLTQTLTVPPLTKEPVITVSVPDSNAEKPQRALAPRGKSAHFGKNSPRQWGRPCYAIEDRAIPLLRSHGGAPLHVQAISSGLGMTSPKEHRQAVQALATLANRADSPIVFGPRVGTYALDGSIPIPVRPSHLVRSAIVPTQPVSPPVEEIAASSVVVEPVGTTEVTDVPTDDDILALLDLLLGRERTYHGNRDHLAKMFAIEADFISATRAALAAHGVG